jgi:hypothetical protein
VGPLVVCRQLHAFIITFSPARLRRCSGLGVPIGGFRSGMPPAGSHLGLAHGGSRYRMEDPIWESVSEDLNFDLRLENQLRIPTEGSAACRKPRCERTRGQLSSTHRKKVGPHPPSPGVAPLFPSCLDIVQDRFPANALDQSE